MSLLGGEDECYVCGKEIDSENCIEEDGKKFCCEKCKEHFEEEQQDKEEVCKFC